MATEKPDPKGAPVPRPVINVVTTTAARAHITCLAGPEKGQEFRIAPSMTTIGRDAGCEIALTETVISRQHCRVERRGEEWILRNLSSNGTVLNKKPVDEAQLSDGDEIRIGAKTRLRFVVEAVATMAGGRPQFRRRSVTEAESGGGPAEGQTDAGTEEKNQEEEGQGSVFKRRKGLFIGLSVYLLAILIVAAYLTLRPAQAGPDADAILAEEDAIRPAPGARAMRFVREAPEGIWCEGPLGDPVLVPYEDLRAGKAVRITGIRKALDVKFQYEVNTVQSERYKKEAMELYRVWRLPGKESNLYGGVRLFQKSLGYSGTGYFKSDPQADKIYQQALKELIEEVCNSYRDAVVNEKAGEYKKAWDGYQRILTLIPDRENPVFTNVSRRMATLRKSLKDVKVLQPR